MYSLKRTDSLCRVRLDTVKRKSLRLMESWNATNEDAGRLLARLQRLENQIKDRNDRAKERKNRSLSIISSIVERNAVCISYNRATVGLQTMVGFNTIITRNPRTMSRSLISKSRSNNPLLNSFIAKAAQLTKNEDLQLDIMALLLIRAIDDLGDNTSRRFSRRLEEQSNGEYFSLWHGFESAK
ncbi:hypothetical protein EG329_001923 [Mollisiaceae sp. DMI_Dod_QoI]|nr:hypothetical protein EG329_001923 [Helotiales sp. DMI_Dod_QoI]